MHLCILHFNHDNNQRKTTSTNAFYLPFSLFACYVLYGKPSNNIFFAFQLLWAGYLTVLPHGAGRGGGWHAINGQSLWNGRYCKRHHAHNRHEPSHDLSDDRSATGACSTGPIGRSCCRSRGCPTTTTTSTECSRFEHGSIPIGCGNWPISSGCQDIGQPDQLESSYI